MKPPTLSRYFISGTAPATTPPFKTTTAMPDPTSQPEAVSAKSRDFFAELYVAGILGDAGWSIYFPKRDVGFDFIAVKELQGQTVLRPVQVKGKYPGDKKVDK